MKRLPKKEVSKCANHEHSFKPNFHLQPVKLLLLLLELARYPEKKNLKVAQDNQKQKHHRKRFRIDEYVFKAKPQKSLNLHRAMKPCGFLRKWEIA